MVLCFQLLIFLHHDDVNHHAPFLDLLLLYLYILLVFCSFPARPLSNRSPLYALFTTSCRNPPLLFPTTVSLHPVAVTLLCAANNLTFDYSHTDRNPFDRPVRVPHRASEATKVRNKKRPVYTHTHLHHIIWDDMYYTSHSHSHTHTHTHTHSHTHPPTHAHA
jgi:hypothetical protein